MLDFRIVPLTGCQTLRPLHPGASRPCVGRPSQYRPLRAVVPPRHEVIERPADVAKRRAAFSPEKLGGDQAILSHREAPGAGEFYRPPCIQVDASGGVILNDFGSGGKRSSCRI